MATTPRERRHQRTRQSILNAAVALIAEKGPDKLSLREIARRIDYSPAGLYEYFGSKDEIIDAVCALGNSQLVDYLRRVSTDLPLTDYLVELGLAYVRFAKDHPAHFILLFGQLVSEQEKTPWEASELHPDSAFTVVYSTMQQALDDGIIAATGEDPALTLSYTVWSLVHGMAVLQAANLKNMIFDFETADRFAMETLIKGMIQTQA